MGSLCWICLSLVFWLCWFLFSLYFFFWFTIYSSLGENVGFNWCYYYFINDLIDFNLLMITEDFFYNMDY